MATNDPDDIADLAPCSGRRKASLAQCEVVRFREAFDAVDVDKDGLVTEEQAADAAHKAGYRLTAAQLQVSTENTTRSPNFVFMLAQRLRRWADIKTTF